jgi:hypothetical protein
LMRSASEAITWVVVRNVTLEVTVDVSVHVVRHLVRPVVVLVCLVADGDFEDVGETYSVALTHVRSRVSSDSV